ncbi:MULTISPECIES: serine/threonine-protein kinase [unclassified Mycobacterium]|uniref:serine/threonine-protein kinase n=1 Tax=unclassified Mycobacterium TaxID=2642494 RepID=UPI0029C7600F|nr:MULTISPECIES: serine/threonine-protein kinase [unclassified Mycobacterium]
MTASRIGEMFGPYELRALIGAGGMGEVYHAYDTSKDRVVALKLLRPELAADRSFQERFRRESRMAARLHEPHVIPVHDFGEINGVLFIDMRFVDGRDLKSLLERGPLSPGRTANIVGQIGSALDAAHASGLTHRDVKPENILMTGDDFAYLVDFGIAHAGGDTGLTSAGSAIGSCAYMAPERFTGDHVGPPADVYSLACVTYECLVGQPPFPPGDLTRLMGAHIMAPPPKPSAMRPDLVAFDGVIAWGMAKDPLARPAAGELARATSASALSAPPQAQQFSTDATPAYVARQVVAEPAAGSSRRLLTIVSCLLVAVLAAAAVAAWLAFGRSETTASSRTTSTATLTRPSTTTPSTVDAPTTTAPPPVLPGTDAQGFLAHPGARCDPGDAPAVLALTAQSALVVCQSATSGYYYRGVRLSDDAGIHLDGARPASGGFDVVNPADGTRYQIRPNALTIITPDDQVFTEPMTEYAS